MLRLELEGDRRETDRADARHWITVYDQLIDVCRQTIGDREPLPGVKMRLYEFERRRAFWMRVLKE